MKLWLISQEERKGCDTYDAAVVAAESEQDAVTISPDGNAAYWIEDASETYAPWASSPEKVRVEYLGEAATGMERGVVVASFHAG